MRWGILPLNHSACDVTVGAEVSRVFRDWQPELVVHCAAYTDVDGCERNSKRAFAVNAEGAANVVRASEQVGAVYPIKPRGADGKVSRVFPVLLQGFLLSLQLAVAINVDRVRRVLLLPRRSCSRPKLFAIHQHKRQRFGPRSWRQLQRAAALLLGSN